MADLNLKISSNQIKKSKDKFKKEENHIEEFPIQLYASDLYNKSNEYAGSSKPFVVGQMSDLVPDFIDKFKTENKNQLPTWKDWKTYYLKEHNEEYNNGLEKYVNFFNNDYKNMLKKIIDDTDLKELKIWWDKLIFFHTFNGLQNEIIIRNNILESFKNEIIKLNNIKSKNFKWTCELINSNPTEESKNIDFEIVNYNENKILFFSVKPDTFSHSDNKMDIEEKNIILITYRREKTKKGVAKTEINISLHDFSVEKLVGFYIIKK